MKIGDSFFAIIIILLFSINDKSLAQENVSSPNIIILLTDDLGYGDLGSYGHPTIKTPNIDALGDQGVRFTSFVTAPWCVPSRTELLTGRHIPRINFGGSTGANGKGGLPDQEVTMAEALKNTGYNTGMAGKWHLGYSEERFLPTNQGFDSWFGLPYSNDYMKPWFPTDEPMVLYRDTEIVEHNVNQDSLTVRYTKEAVNYILDKSDKEDPFFFYLAYNMPHLPIQTTKEHRGKSSAGLYGDVIETIDWSVGQILKALEQQEISKNTIVFFASDNGPWLNMPSRMLQGGNELWHQGTAGPLRNSKSTTYEGGTRVPAVIRWPAQIPSGQVADALVASPDIYRTFLEVSGSELPNHKLDGFNLLPFLTDENNESPRNSYAYFLRGELEAMRDGKWKLHLAGDEIELFDLQVDPGERFNRADEYPEVVQDIKDKMKDLAREVKVPIAQPDTIRKVSNN